MKIMSNFHRCIQGNAVISCPTGATGTNTVGRKIQRRLNANDRLSIRLEFTTGINPIGNNLTSYTLPSLMGTKIAP